MCNVTRSSKHYISIALAGLRSSLHQIIKESARQGLDMAQAIASIPAIASIHGTHFSLFTTLKCNKICNRIRINAPPPPLPYRSTTPT